MLKLNSGLKMACGSMLALVLSVGAANASCSQRNLEGTYANSRGDQFRIEQPSCDRAIFTDLQQDIKFEIKMDGSSNKLEETSLIFAHDLVKSMPVSYSLDRSRSRDGITILTLRTELGLSKKDHDSGLSNPTLLVDARLGTAEYDGKIQGLYFSIDNARAVVSKNASATQRALVKGINMGIKLASNLSFGSFYYEYLRKID